MSRSSALPAANEPTCSHNATQLGKLAGSSAKAANQRLALLGLQFRNERDEWELTDAGKAWAESQQGGEKESSVCFHEQYLFLNGACFDL